MVLLQVLVLLVIIYYLIWHIRRIIFQDQR